MTLTGPYIPKNNHNISFSMLIKEVWVEDLAPPLAHFGTIFCQNYKKIQVLYNYHQNFLQIFRILLRFVGLISFTGSGETPCEAGIVGAVSSHSNVQCPVISTYISAVLLLTYQTAKNAINGWIIDISKYLSVKVFY